MNNCDLESISSESNGNVIDLESSSDTDNQPSASFTGERREKIYQRWTQKWLQESAEAKDNEDEWSMGA